MGRHSTPTALRVDATNRSVRTLLVGLVVDVLVALASLVTVFFVNKTGWSEFNWAVISFALAKTAVMSAGSYILRAFLDRSSVPTPLPPSPVVPPHDPNVIPVTEAEEGP